MKKDIHPKQGYLVSTVPDPLDSSKKIVVKILTTSVEVGKEREYEFVKGFWNDPHWDKDKDKKAAILSAKGSPAAKFKKRFGSSWDGMFGGSVIQDVGSHDDKSNDA